MKCDQCQKAIEGKPHMAKIIHQGVRAQARDRPHVRILRGFRGERVLLESTLPFCDKTCAAYGQMSREG